MFLPYDAMFVVTGLFDDHRGEILSLYECVKFDGCFVVVSYDNCGLFF